MVPEGEHAKEGCKSPSGGSSGLIRNTEVGSALGLALFCLLLRHVSAPQIQEADQLDRKQLPPLLIMPMQYHL